MRIYVIAMAVGATITLSSNAGFAQYAPGYFDAPGAPIDAYSYGPWWQYRGGPKSTSTTDLIYAAPVYTPYGYVPYGVVPYGVVPPDGYGAR
jgi:hypothetical protein